MTSPHGTFEIDDRDLIVRAQPGDRQAFTELVTRHQVGVIRLAYRMCGDLRLAEHSWLAQRLDTFLCMNVS